uniref:Uncharacterized protein n=1 Tax=Utricularia reniformis TaxID=192314 RepID=A0A1Y0B099_9LAMI|nr:hypothetical protein AEK19_MT0567 [Utricularia reniformis]ART30823.1 hypothetical protein AEK19_MT0567 [Utricularia reniformis]
MEAFQVIYAKPSLLLLTLLPLLDRWLIHGILPLAGEVICLSLEGGATRRRIRFANRKLS